MGGAYLIKGGDTLLDLAKQIQKELNSSIGRHMNLDGPISIVDREQIVSQMRSKKGKKQFIIFPSLDELLKDQSIQWFGFFHLHT